MPEGPETLSIVVFDGAFERVHYAFVLASGAAATNRAVTLFFSGRALHALRPQGWTRLDGGDAGHPAAHEAELSARGLATFQALREACRELGVRFMACELGLKSQDLGPQDLDPALKVEIAGVATFLNGAPKTGAILFV